MNNPIQRNDVDGKVVYTITDARLGLTYTVDTAERTVIVDNGETTTEGWLEQAKSRPFPNLVVPNPATGKERRLSIANAAYNAIHGEGAAWALGDKYLVNAANGDWTDLSPENLILQGKDELLPPVWDLAAGARQWRALEPGAQPVVPAEDASRIEFLEAEIRNMKVALAAAMEQSNRQERDLKNAKRRYADLEKKYFAATRNF